MDLMQQGARSGSSREVSNQIYGNKPCISRNPCGGSNVLRRWNECEGNHRLDNQFDYFVGPMVNVNLFQAGLDLEL